MFDVRVFGLILAVVLPGAVAFAHADSTAGAMTCRIRSVTDPQERLDSAIDNEWSEIVLVGVVTEELPLTLDPAAPGGYRAASSSDASSGDPVFQSTVKVQAVLKGGPVDEEFVLTGLSEVWQCSSGPLLPEGERVLLFLGRWPVAAGIPVDEQFTWQTNLIGGQVFLTNGRAILTDYQSDNGGTYLGGAEDVVSYVAERLGANEEARAAALAALNAPAPASDSDFRWLPMTIGLIAVGLGLGVLVVLTWARRGTSRP